MKAFLGALTTLLAVAGVHSVAMAGDWIVSADGRCVERWTAADLARGPVAIINGGILPLRSLVGGFALAADECSLSRGCSLTAPLYPILGPILGGTMGVYWMLTGAADTVTGGLGLLSSPEASTFSVAPVVPFVSDVSVNRCGS